MRIYNTYVISLELTACLVNTVLALWGQNNLEIYFTANIISFLVITLLHVYLNPRARGALNAIGFVLFGGFMVIVAFKVIEIISGR